MTIQNALTFIKRGQKEQRLRHQLVRARKKETLERIFARENLIFSRAEFEEAYSLSLFKCQDPGEADALMAFRMWWVMLERSHDFVQVPVPAMEKQK